MRESQSLECNYDCSVARITLRITLIYMSSIYQKLTNWKLVQLYWSEGEVFLTTLCHLFRDVISGVIWSKLWIIVSLCCVIEDTSEILLEMMMIVTEMLLEMLMIMSEMTWQDTVTGMMDTLRWTRDTTAALWSSRGSCLQSIFFSLDTSTCLQRFLWCFYSVVYKETHCSDYLQSNSPTTHIPSQLWCQDRWWWRVDDRGYDWDWAELSK